MHTTIHLNRLSSVFTRTAALTLFAAAATLGLNAQQSAGTAQFPVSLKSTLIAPLDLSSSSSSSDDLNYGSSTGLAETAAAEGFSFGARPDGGIDQPPPRRRYGRPNYHDSRTNSDGSSKYTFAVGAGFTMPTGGTHNYAKPNWRFQVGVGRNFNKTIGVIAQFDYDHFGIQTSTLNNQLDIYNNLCQQSSGQNCFDQLGGNIHDWSFTLNPIVNYYTSDTFGSYLIGGVGFYHKVTSFTTPTTGNCYDPYYGYYPCQADQAVDVYTSNAVGFNGGIGFTYKASRFSSGKFYAEARYVWTDNKPRPFDISGNTPYFNAFPQASARTTYIPVTFGYRW
jgi:hypothetical protein